MTINTGKYCLLNGGRDTVIDGPRTLPSFWHGYHNFDQRENYSDDELRALGWYPYTLIDSGWPVPSDAYIRTVGPFVIGGLEVTQTASYAEKDIEELRILRNDQLESNNRINPTTWEMVMDSLTQYRVSDMEEWISDQQIALTIETDWNAVANFQTTSPQILALGNQYVAQQYQEQGASLTAVNQAAVGSGQSAPYDQVEVDAFVQANEPAAADPSGTTQPVPPTYKLRQGVANVSEERSILWIYRKDNDTYLELKLTNREDARDLYVFMYLATGTFLQWAKFEQSAQNLNEWIARSAAGSVGWIPSDLKLRLSYSTNPAVESDLFTDDVFFDAGAAPIKTLVRWDRD